MGFLELIALIVVCALVVWVAEMLLPDKMIWFKRFIQVVVVCFLVLYMLKEFELLTTLNFKL